MATGISNFTATSSGDNVGFSLSWEGFTCASNPEVRVRLIDTDTNVSVATLVYDSGIGTTGTVLGTFNNIYDGVFRASAIFICNGNVISIYDSANVVHGSSINPPPPPPAPPGTGPTGVGSNNINANNNLGFCIGSSETNVSFSKLNEIFGRRAGNTPNTELSGEDNPSTPPSIFGFSYLPLNEETPGKRRQNAVSELRGTCNYVAPNLYSVTLEVGASFVDGNGHIIVPYKVVWVHAASGNLTEECPFDNSRVQVFLSVRVNNSYVGPTTPSPYRARVTKFTFATSGTSNQDTTRSATASVGTTSHNRQITLAYRDRVFGFLEGENVIVQPTQTFKMTLTVNIANVTYHELASIQIPNIPNARPLVIERVVAGSGEFTYSFSNSLSGSGATSSALAVSAIFSNTRSSPGTNNGSGTSTNTGNRTVSITPNPSSLYTTLRVEENGMTIYNVTQLGSQSTTINFLSGATYIVTGLSTTAIQ